MRNIWLLFIGKYRYVLDLFFISLLFLLTSYEVSFFGPYINEREVSFVFMASIWGICKLVVSKLEPKKISAYDFGFLLLFLCLIINFQCLSETSYYYSRFWVYLFYFFAFYLFRWIFNSKTNKRTRFHFTLFIILISVLIQSAIALLQRYDYVEVDHMFFNLLGSFPSPNYLGAYIGFGVIILLWYFFIHRIKKIWLLSIGLVCASIVIVVIIMSNSRGSWLALIGAIVLLILTSRKSIRHIRNLSVTKKTIGLLSLIVLAVIGCKHLYMLNTESVQGRILIAKITTQEIIDKPLFGHGLFSFPSGYNRAKAEYFKYQERPWDEIKVGDYVYTTLNDYLMIGYELGLLLLFLIISLGLFIFFTTKITSETRLGMALVLNIAIWASFNSALGSVPIMMIGIFGISLMFAYGNLNKRRLSTHFHIKRYMLLSLVLFFSSFGIYAVFSKVRGVQKFKNYYTYNKGNLDKDKLINLSRPLENNRNNEFELGKALYKLGYSKEGYDFMEKSFGESSLPASGKQLAEFYIKDGNYNRAKDIYQFNINVEPYRYEPQMNLISLMEKVNGYNEVVKLSQKVVSFPVKIPSEEVTEYKKLSEKRVQNFSKYIDTILKGSLSRPLIINSELLNKKLLYKIYLPPISNINKKLPVIYLNDGRSYIDKGKVVKVLDSLIHNHVINPVAAVFLEPKDGYKKWQNVRQELFLCNSDFVDFFLEEFIPHIESRYPVSSLKNDRTIMGMSFGGLAAAHMVNISPTSFKNVIMQSPSLHPCPEIYRAYSSEPKRDLNIYLSYGTEKDTEYQVLPFVRILREKEYSLKVKIEEGGNHSWNTWRSQMSDIFIHFFSK